MPVAAFATIIYGNGFFHSADLLLICHCLSGRKNRSAKARRRRRNLQHADRHSSRYQPVSENSARSNKIPRPSKAYQIYDIPTERAKTTTASKNRLRTKTTASNIIRPLTIGVFHEQPTARLANDRFSATIEKTSVVETIELPPRTIEPHIGTTELSIDSPKETRAQSTVSVTRVKTTRGCQSTPDAKAQRSSRFDVFVTRVRNNIH